ncbi:hypothetical protein GT347_00565 [Xylophilus rhododendri]|uniref:EF-hand domain-containing protein n=1 Tax=Xylophilus rhododendri TaxID=2697032 RepID=A0A857IYI6_9BURK|nr:hypothetical protein [Xylophilus rhododendri]QHI96620.1 hypothetical protein GT347_00565 [Xylophilus rhododendri]
MQHQWQFFRAGGVDQVLIRDGQDIAHIGELDQKLWVALACPTRGLEFDSATLDLIDTDHDGRIRPPELIAACQWACGRLTDPDELIAGGDSLDLARLSTADEAGQALVQEARRVLGLLGREHDSTISLADVADRSKLLTAMRFNGDGIVTAETALEDASAAQTIAWIGETRGTVDDRGGKPGIDRKRAEAFFKDVHALIEWHSVGLADPQALPLGDGTLAAAQAVNAVREKVEDFFTRARLARYDARAAVSLNPTPEEYAAIATQELTTASASIAALPLAPVGGDAVLLPLVEGVNPAWAAALSALRSKAVKPLLAGRADVLSEADWRLVLDKLTPYKDWLASRPDAVLGTLTIEQVLAAQQTEAAVLALLAQDEAEEPASARMADLEKLLRFKRDLVLLLNNFVSFGSFYRRSGAIFQAGRLYLDARSCDLTVKVADAGKHAALAGLAKTCLAYCECTREGQKMTIVAAFTAGDVDFLFVGRNGVFYDRQGKDWDATIVKLMENPTSVAQAFFSPYKKFLRAIEEQVAKRAAASDAASQAGLGTLAGELSTADKAAAAGKPPADLAKLPGSKVDVGTVAAIGVAAGSISAVLVGVFAKFVELGAWIPLAILGIVLAISGPSMLIAWLKLRQRSLGPILDATGWAVNGRMKVNVPLGASLSQTAHIPAGSKRSLQDAYREKRGAGTWLLIGLVTIGVLALVWRSGLVDPYLTPALRHANPPAATAAATPAR